jgi:hypothetical protein
MRRQHVNMSTAEYKSWAYPPMLVAKLPHEAVDFFGSALVDRMQQCYEDVKPMKVALILSDWVEGHSAKDIEEEYDSLAGTIRAAGETSSWLTDAAASIADLLEFPKVEVEFLQDLSVRLERGVSSAGVPLCRVRVRGFGRTHIQKLVSAGICDVDGIRNATDEALTRAIGKAMAKRVREFVLALRAQEAAEPGASEDRSAPEEQTGPADPAQLFNCNDRIHFDASVSTRRTVIVISGEPHPIPNKTFALMLRLAIRLTEDGVGWVKSDEFGEYPIHAISNARKEVQHLLADRKADLFDNDGYGSYRLSVPPKNVSFDWEKIRVHWDGQIAPLAKLAPVTVGCEASE